MLSELGPFPGQGQVRQGKSDILLHKLGQDKRRWHRLPAQLRSGYKRSVNLSKGGEVGEYMFINLSLAYRDHPHQPKPSPGHPDAGPGQEEDYEPWQGWAPRPDSLSSRLSIVLADIAGFRKPRRSLETFKKVGIPIIAVLLSLMALVIVAFLSE